MRDKLECNMYGEMDGDSIVHGLKNETNSDREGVCRKLRG